jgi:hypothetical protein
MTGERGRFEYVVDANDVLVEVNDAWRTFARENDGGDLEEEVIGTWLWQHLAGLEVKHLFRILLEKVRENREPVMVPFRCDAPELRREMMLEMTPLEADAVRFSSWIVEEVHRPRVELLDANRAPSPDELIRMCAWCKRVGVKEGEWRELEDAVLEAELFHQDPLPKITHGVCPECQSMVLKELSKAG